jgi:small-conductance mechanosensitive channel
MRVTSRATVLLTLDGNQVRIPNATVFKGLIVNFTAQPQRRFSLRLGIAPDEDLGRAQRVAVAALAGVDGVLDDPPPAALYESVGESTVNLSVTGWMDQSSHDFFRVRSEAIRVVLGRMTEIGVDLPEPTVRFRRAAPVGRADRAAATDAHPVVVTGRDRSLDRVVKRERTRRPDLLDQAVPQE